MSYKNRQYFVAYNKLIECHIITAIKSKLDYLR